MSAQDQAGGFDGFVSYGSSDREWVETFHAALAERGAFYLDRRELEAGASFPRELSDALERSRFLILVLSNDSVDRPWVEAEWNAFVAFHGPVDRVIPVMLESVEMPALLSPAQQVDATNRDAARAASVVLERIAAPGIDELGRHRHLVTQDVPFTVRQHDAEDGPELTVIGPDGQERRSSLPWSDPKIWFALHTFGKLSREAAETDGARGELHRAAKTVGTALADTLFATDELRGRVTTAIQPGYPRPLVWIRSDDDRMLSLPWELLCVNDVFLVQAGYADVVRSTLGMTGPRAQLREPTEPFSLVINVSAPEGATGLDHERETYRLVKALHGECRSWHTELGTAEDLVQTVGKHPPTGIHFSGHGSRGSLLFEDDEGRSDDKPIQSLTDELRRSLEGDLPRFFFLASCHGNDPGVARDATPAADPSGADARGAAVESAAAHLQREGVAQVVGYTGPIVDILSTRAETALYREIAAGKTTLHAVRHARNELQRPLEGHPREHRPSVLRQADAAASVPPSEFPFAWAQLVLYTRGPAWPLGAEQEYDPVAGAEALQRSFEGKLARSRLKHGFIGRRADLHRLRRSIRAGKRVLVLQGLGGLGKTCLALHALPIVAKNRLKCVIEFWCQEVEHDDDPIAGLVGQLRQQIEARIGAPDAVSLFAAIDQQIPEPSIQFATLVNALTAPTESGGVGLPTAVLYFDNLESLLHGPEDLDDPDVHFADWKSEKLAALWTFLTDHANGSDTLFVVASSRYYNESLQTGLQTVEAFPGNALFRLMDWYPTLRRLSLPTRARLVGHLFGHPRAVEFLDDLLEDHLAKHERRHGEWRLPRAPSDADVEREWTALIDPTLGEVEGKIGEDLLLDRLWDTVLDDASRRMLFRMTLLRRPWPWSLMRVLGEPGDTEAETNTRAERLAQTSLLERIEVVVQTDDGGAARGARFLVHPMTVRFVRRHYADAADMETETHARVGNALKDEFRRLEGAIEAGWHLFQARAFDAAYELLGGCSNLLQDRGRARQGLAILAPFLASSVASSMRSDLVGRLRGNVGNAFFRLSQVDKAIEHQTQALAVARQIGDREAEEWALGNLGNAYNALGQVDNAIKHYAEALAIAREIGDRQGEGSALGSLGLAFSGLGRVQKAIEHYAGALTITREIGDRRGEGTHLRNLGREYTALGQIEKAIEHYNRGLAITREIGDREGEAGVLGNLGLVYTAIGRVDRAIEHHTRELAICRKIGDRRGEGNAVAGLGSAHFKLGQVGKAIEHYTQALAIARAIDNRRSEGTSLGSLGLAYARIGQVHKAIEHYTQGLAISREIGDRRGEGGTLVNLGTTYARLGEVDKGRKLLNAAHEISVETEDPRTMAAAQEALETIESMEKGDSDPPD